ncbi:flagellar hook assembly protein FlgD [Yersinia bercovieri]|uniref:Basal-body rod modification protein FlgD n=2 Tax=Yersinia bercovieri TaxID=634 RepID=A0A2G4U6L8_YERBE|nr:flagellar hook capping FlgD N-terminal domain-containing protein [Yersinia bercovieri]MDN0101588.1 flagellar hook capping FlgD N-terminal domain-containing protein [Yersinia bercovieri]PHZ28967.1 flagellar biosynthesis protein FlgD [Yersinia bercovieri]QKJ06083.1 flagellar biosynthesis protein FlgD [Yersinia bercovieri ATCC 43970]CFQ36317.1 flagellar basal body rod modification protein [Yersinia bercovieri]CNI83141.1 flagellar basal body rod modification protein [Yersinia bercovieri]
MGVSSVMNSTDVSGGTGSSGGNSIEDLSNSFMTLLVAQMQNQDPTNPMDNNQLTSQLAQFNTASGVQQLNSTLNSVGTLVTSMQQMNAAEWVGRNVWIEGESVISFADDGNKEFAFAADTDVDKVTVTLTDSQGNAYSAVLENVKAGVNKFTFDDLSSFQPAEPPTDIEGGYKVSFSASNSDGSVPNVSALKKAKVDGVSFTTAGAVLQLGLNGTATLGNIYLIE